MLRDAGALEVHLRISAPPIRHPCFYGIDMPRARRWSPTGAPSGRSPSDLGADSLAYVSLAGVYEAIRGDRDRHCDACFSGDYPLKGTEEAQGKFALENTLPMVPAASPAPA